MKDYRNHNKDIIQFFDYDPSAYKERLAHLKKRTFQREQLRDTLLSMNKKWDAPTHTLRNIKRLEDDNSVVVIGGQQAGLLTGPLYTINKIISIIQCAKEQQLALNIPVIPMFWIAGEDHDFAEINHIYMLVKERMTKLQVSQHINGKKPISYMNIQSNEVNSWINQLFQTMPETEHTKDLYQSIIDCLELSETFVDFFARLLFTLFPDEGLVLLDSANKDLRQLESLYFKQLIDKQQDIAQGVYETSQKLRRMGYSVTLDASINDAHLFYHMNDERILLKRNNLEEWVGKQEEVTLSTKELQRIAEETPERLSNNVVTRPIMQEMLFPTLTFIGGPGEISYWALLKQSFHAVNLRMPPVLPRLSMTFVDRHIEKILNTYHLSVTTVINEGVNRDKLNWLSSQYDPPIDKLVDQVKQSIREVHKPLREVAFNIRPDIGELADKNLYHLQSEIDYLYKRMHQAIEEKYNHPLTAFNLLTQTLRPEDGLQERTWNILPFINMHGKTFLKQLLKQTYSFTKDHYIVYL